MSGKKTYEIDADDLLDLLDLATCASFTNRQVRCPGGRIIVDGYICIHCRADPGDKFDDDGKKVFREQSGQRVYRRCNATRKRLLETDLSGLIGGHMVED